MALSHAQPLLLILLVSLLILPAALVYGARFTNSNTALVYGARYTNCNNSYEYPTEVSSVDISPYPVKKDGRVVITITGFTWEEIPNDAPVSLQLYEPFTYTPLGRKEYYSLCRSTVCPVPIGPLVLTFSDIFRTPLDIPRKFGGYDVVIRIFNNNIEAKKLMCGRFFVKVNRFEKGAAYI